MVSSHVMLLANVGLLGGIGLSLADKSCGWFPNTFPSSISTNIADSALVDMKENGTARLVIFVSDMVSIHGELKGLSNDDIVRFKKSPHGRSYIGDFLCFVLSMGK